MKVEEMTFPPESLAKVAALLGRRVEMNDDQLEAEMADGNWVNWSDWDAIGAILLRVAEGRVSELKAATDSLHAALREGTCPLAAVIAAAVGEEG